MAEQPQRRPYTGSCHCGDVRYIAYLTLPHTPPTEPAYVQNFYRCNCTSCHKMGFLHARLNSSPDDFLLLSPSGDPLTELGDYQCDTKALHYLYCKNCAVRCFLFMGPAETVDVDLRELGLSEEALARLESGLGEGSLRAWRPKKDVWKEGQREYGCYLSVNGCTFDQDQEGLDLREWTEKKWMCYLQILKEDGKGEQPRYNRPHEGGMY